MRQNSKINSANRFVETEEELTKNAHRRKLQEQREKVAEIEGRLQGNEENLKGGEICLLG